MEELLIDGVSYVASREAARYAGYATDYVGQLCRQGSLECTRVGRSWYINKNSLEHYLKQQESESKVRAEQLRSEAQRARAEHNVVESSLPTQAQEAKTVIATERAESAAGVDTVETEIAPEPVVVMPSTESREEEKFFSDSATIAAPQEPSQEVEQPTTYEVQPESSIPPVPTPVSAIRYTADDSPLLPTLLNSEQSGSTVQIHKIYKQVRPRYQPNQAHLVSRSSEIHELSDNSEIRGAPRNEREQRHAPLSLILTSLVLLVLATGFAISMSYEISYSERKVQATSYSLNLASVASFFGATN